MVLAATAALFWFARRDLANHAAPPAVPADTRELEQLCVTLEALVTDLSHRLDAVERRLASGSPASESVKILPRPAVEPPAPESPRPDADPRHAPVYALIQAGETDPQEIVRRTGLARGEVDLILSLHARRAL